jgi:hypothetical protein
MHDSIMIIKQSDHTTRNKIQPTYCRTGVPSLQTLYSALIQNFNRNCWIERSTRQLDRYYRITVRMYTILLV